MNPPAGDELKVMGDGTASLFTYTVAVIIYLFRVLRPWLVNWIIIPTMIKIDVNPPVTLLY